MRSRTGVVALIAVAPVLLAACGQSSKVAPAAALPTQLVGNVEQLQPGSLTGQDISAAQRAFGLALLSRVCGKDGPNTLISPASAADALGLLDAAAGGATATAMSKLLRLPVWGPAVVAAVHDHHATLAALSAGKGDTLRTSNRVWPTVGNPPTAGYLNDVRTAYDAQLQTVDFLHHAAAATDTINKQVGLDTDGLIPKLFDSPLDRKTVAVLTNAMVLKAHWSSPLLVQQAKSAFRTATGGRSSVLQMDSTEPSAYTAVGGWQAAQLPYVSGTMDAVAILPPTKAAACALPTTAQLARLTAASTQRTEVTLPQMHLDQQHDLLAVLTAMGLPSAGDYSGLGGSQVTEVVQKDVMTVDQLGTVAAAATGIAVAASSESPGPAHHLTFDRPFLLLLQDTRTHTPLFLASIGDASMT
jgi:serpin B